MLLTSGINRARKRRTRNRRRLDVGFFNTFEAWPSCNIALQEGHATGTLVVIMKEGLLFLELLFKLPLPADDIQSDTRLDESVSPDRLATMLAYPMASSALAINASDRKVRYQYADSFGELRI